VNGRALLAAGCLMLPHHYVEAADSRASKLIEAPGWKIVDANCTVCHSARLIVQQRADRRGWLRIIRWMQDTQGLWLLTPETENTILDYLASAYPESAATRRRPLPANMLPPPPDVEPEQSR